MKVKLLIPVLLVLLLTFGCGNKETEKITTENAAKLSKLNRDLATATETIAKLKGDLAGRITKVEDNTKEILDKLGQKATMKTAKVETRDPGEGEPETLADGIDTIGYDISNMTESLKTLTEQLTALKEQMDTFTSANEEVQRAAERRQQWDDMNDPAKLASKLDEFMKAHSQKLTDQGLSSYEFEQDMTALKAGIEQEYTPDELATKAKTDLEQRIADTENERMQGWMQRRLDQLNSAEGDELVEQLERYQRMSNMRAIGEVTQKYEIPRDDLRDAGIMTWGGRGGGGRIRGGGGGGG